MQLKSDIEAIFSIRYKTRDLRIYMGYSRVEIAAAARQWPMKLYLYTAIGLQQSRCYEIGSPVG